MNYSETQRADDFKVGQKVIVRDETNVFVTTQDTLKPGEVYTIDRIEIVNENLGTGQFRLVERQDGDFDGAFGHLLFDHAPADAAAYPPIESYSPGDRVEIVNWDSPGDPYWNGPATVTRVDGYIVVKSDRDPNRGEGGFPPQNVRPLADEPLKVGDRVKITAGHEAFHGRTGVISGTESGRFTLTLDNPPSEGERLTDDPNGGLWLAGSLERVVTAYPIADLPDLSDAEVRKTLPTEQAYPIGSVWNHISSGYQPVTITGYADPTPSGREQVTVTMREYLGQQPYEGTWVRGALDSYGTLVSLPDGPADGAPREVNEPELPTFNVGDEVPVDVLKAHAGIKVDRNGRDEWTTHGDGTMTARYGGRMGIGYYDPEHTPRDHWVEDGWKFLGMVKDDIAPADSDLADRYMDLAEERDALKDAVDTLRNEIDTLKQAAADERRRLCAEIDDLKAERATAIQMRVNLAEQRVTDADEIRDLRKSLAEQAAELTELRQQNACFDAGLAYAEGEFLAEEQIERLSAYVTGYRDALSED